MAKKLLSFLGIGKYQECIYSFNGDKVKTKFIQRALTDIFCKEWYQEDEIIIFLTDAARKMHWESGLKNELLSQNYLATIKEKNIPIGKDINEIWDIFKAMMESLNEGDEIIFDITHSFRSIPMLALVVLNYAKLVKNIKILGIYYGAYDYDAQNCQGEAPIFDLSDFDKLLEWSYATYSFVESGDSKQIFNIVNKEKKYDHKYREIYNFAKNLNIFTNSIYTCKGMVLDDPERSVYGAYKEMQESLNKLKEKENYPVIYELFNLVEKKAEVFKSNDNLLMGIAFIQWCVENDLVQQGYTALNETIKTFICKINGLNDSDKDDREEIAAKAMAVYKIRDNEEKWRVQEKYKNKIREVLNNTPNELFKISESVATSRNDINHFGFTIEGNRKKVSLLKKELKEKFEEFKKIYNNYF